METALAACYWLRSLLTYSERAATVPKRFQSPRFAIKVRSFTLFAYIIRRSVEALHTPSPRAASSRSLTSAQPTMKPQKGPRTAVLNAKSTGTPPAPIILGQNARCTLYAMPPKGGKQVRHLAALADQRAWSRILPHICACSDADCS